jgi:hypothetical protein
LKKRRTFAFLLCLMAMALVCLFQTSQTAVFPPRNIDTGRNMVWGFLNASSVVAATKLSNRNPLVGDVIDITVEVNDSVNGKGISSLLADLEVISPSGKLLLREAHQTDENGLAQYSQMLLTEAGIHHVKVGITRNGENVSRITDSFRVGYRVQVGYTGPEIRLTQGEQTSLKLNLTSESNLAENVILKVDGGPYLPCISVPVSLKPGYNNITVPISINETVATGKYNVTILVMPTTMEYTSGCYNTSLVVTPAYDIDIVKAPSVIAQGSISELVVQLRSHRSVTLVATLRIDSCNVLLKGEADIMILRGETKQITLALGEVSGSPYQWGEGNIRVSLLRNVTIVGESSCVTVHVSPSLTSIVLGYVLPVAIPLPILVERSRKMKAKLAISGVMVGGTVFFLIGVVICQSSFMIVPLTMLIAGCYIGTMTIEHIADLSLPKRYNWSILSRMTDIRDRANKGRSTFNSIAIHSIPQYVATGLTELENLHNARKYDETIPLAYTLVVGTLSDWLALGSYVKPLNSNKYPDQPLEENQGKVLTALIKQLRENGVIIPSQSRLKELEELYGRYVEFSRQGSDNNRLGSRLKSLSRKSIDLVAAFISQKT